jgi:nifR3 family TIM-barrel protein
MIVADGLADHVDLNFGCPVPKVTRKGGGAALPWRLELFADIVTAAVRAAEHLPVTVKMRIGIDTEHVTYREAGLRAQEAGVRWVALHARTAKDFYSGNAQWDAIADLVELLDVPVLGNGDIWEADDALRMVRETGCAGVVVGRGCLGRPWLFANLAAVFAGRADPGHPGLAQVADTLRRHAALMAADGGQRWAACEIRKHIAWYLKGFAVGPALRSALGLVESTAQLDELLARLDTDQLFPAEVVGVPRGRAGSPRQVALPDGWLADALDGEVGHEPQGALVTAGG